MAALRSGAPGCCRAWRGAIRFLRRTRSRQGKRGRARLPGVVRTGTSAPRCERRLRSTRMETTGVISQRSRTENPEPAATNENGPVSRAAHREPMQLRLRHEQCLHLLQRVGFDLADALGGDAVFVRSEEHTSELPSLMRNSYAVFCLNKK